MVWVETSGSVLALSDGVPDRREFFSQHRLDHHRRGAYKHGPHDAGGLDGAAVPEAGRVAEW